MSDEKTKEQLTPLHYHEVTHTAHVVQELFDNSIVKHSAVVRDIVLKKAARDVEIALAKFYGIAAERGFDFAEGKFKSP